MNGLMYTAEFSVTGATAVQDLFSLLCSDPDMGVLHKIVIGQENIEGDVNAEMLDIAIGRAGAVGSVGSAPTPRPHMNGAPAASITCRANDTTPAATPTFIYRDSFNLQAGWIYAPTPEERYLMSAASGANVLIVKLLTAPKSATDFNGSIVWEEFLG